MEYRTTSATDNGFDSEAEEHEALRTFIQNMMDRSGPEDLLDMVLVVVNVCELRALLNSYNPKLHDWYTNTALMLRGALDMVARKNTTFKPLDKLEQAEFYFPETHISH